MRLKLSASVSSLGRGDGDRLGVRTKKKHKRLDAISDDVFIRSRDVRIGDIGRSGGGGSVENDDSEVRRSSRVRRAPEVLDSSPPAKRRRRKGGRGRGYGGFRGKGKVENEAGSEGSGSSDEELGSWRSRTSLRLKEKKSRGKRKLFENVEEDEEDVRATRDLNLEDEEPIVDGETSGDENDAKVDSVEGSNTRGKKKLYEAVEEDEEEAARSMKNTTVDNLKEEGPCLDGEKSGDEEETMVDRVGGSIDVRIETEDDHSIGERLARGVDDLVNEEVGDCTPSTIGVIEEIDREVPTVTMLDEKVDRNEHTGGSSQTDKPVNSHELVESAETQNQATGATPLPTVLAENGNDEVAKNMEPKNGLKVKNNVAAGEHPKPRIKEGRRCGLCGGGTDGKPPKKLVTDSGGSDQEAYSGSSASEEFSYDLWDGFGDESGWQGKLLGPVNDRHGIAGIWVHQHCAVWSPEVYFAGLGRLKNIRAALCRGRALKCTRCGRPGATLGCRVDRCPRTYHLPCARASGCHFDHRKFLIACVDHRYLFEPHGHQYSQRIKKLKAKKMKFEVRKLSNDASRKDLEEEEKWMEKCGEDEEFLRRETKRLQRDLLRIAPVYIGGPHSEGENSIGGWESVAGLQDVVQCMKEVVILPLLYPEFFGNMGITPPRGVLLHGYPGTGKTLVVRALIGSCARGDKRIAYFAHKGADCLGKYVGDAERQLRLLFQVAEKSQPSIIFFDEIDGLAPVRTRQQDQTHSSVVSTLLALMDGLKSRGSVIVIGATNRPDSVDPALRRPGRFDREIYFPLPSLKDRSAILALHTRKWPKPVSGPLLERVASQTVGFAGADLQALCAQAAVIGLKRNCSWHQILSSAEENPGKGRRPELPSFEVEERDWLEALCLAPPPCSRREAGIAANEVLGTPLDAHLVPCLLQPLLSLILSFYLDDRLWLPHCLVAAGKAVKKAVVSQMEAKNLQNNKWVYLAQNMAQNPNIAREIVRNLIDVGIVKGDASLTGFDISKDASFDDGETYRCSFGDRPSGMSRNVRYAPSKNAGYRIMISGAPRCGQKHLASCLLHSFLGNIEIQKLDLATISQEGHGDMEQGILRILLKCASLRTCVIFMPRLDFWAIESHTQSLEQDVEVSPVCESPKGSSLMPCQDSQNETCYVSKIWKIFREQLECLCISSSSIILATSELPHASLPFEIRQFFGSQLLASEGLSRMEQGTPRFSVEVNGELDQNELIHLSAVDLSRNLIQQFVHVVHLGSHHYPDSNVVQENHFKDMENISAQEADLRSVEDPGARQEPSEKSDAKLLDPSGHKNLKEKSTSVVAVITFGYQILRYPHFAELCWTTSKLNEGPSADIRGPWKGWPFNSCIIRPCQLMQKDAVSCNSNNINGRDKFTLVRGLIAVGLSAYRGEYKSSREVCLEVRKVLKLLVEQINARIQAGKDRYQYVRLLSQVAYLEDMVNNWSHTLRSFEPEDLTEVTTCNVSGAPLPEDHQAPTVEPMGVEHKPNAECGGLQEVQLETGGLPGLAAEGSLNGSVVTIQGEDFQKADLVEGGFQRSLAESSQPADLTTEPIANRTDFAINDEMSPGRAVDVNVDIAISDDMSLEKPIDFEITDNPRNESCEHVTKLEVLCSYSSCSGCTITLQELVEKIIIQEKELSETCSTVEDIYDLVSSLSTNLCLGIRNLSITPKLGCETFQNFESRESNACQCPSSESRLSKFMDCVCHAGKDIISEELKSSSFYDQPGLPSKYIFRDGVLVSVEPDKEFSFHCKYDTLCLCSLVKLIIRTKHLNSL